MNIVFDYQIFRLQKYGGISRYFIELAKHLQQIDGCNPKIISTNSINEYLKELQNTKICSPENYILKKLAYNRYLDYRDKYAKLLLDCKSNKNSILHETYYTNRIHTKLKKVITIHDMIYELIHNSSEGEKFVIQTKREAIQQADHIITVSENTKLDLLKFYPEVKDKVTVVYHGISSIDVNSIPSFDNSRPYVLFIGNREGYKNFEALLEVYVSSSKIHQDFDLICFGGQPFYEHELKIINDYNLSHQIKQINGSDDLLNSLYKGASSLAYLSTYEGFGFPVLEAFRLNCPVVCSNLSSLPEVAGNCAQLINVDDKHDILNALDNILFHRDNFAEIINKARQRAESFSWKKCAEETHQVYQKIKN